MPRGVKWWIPATGLLATATLITAGFGWTVGRATHASAEQALDDAGIAGVQVENSYRDIILYGPDALKGPSLAVVEPARLVQSAAYITGAPVDPSPDPMPTVTVTASPEPTAEPAPTPQPSPSPDATCEAMTPECMGGSAWLATVLTADDSVFFAFDSAELTRAARNRLDAVAQKIVAALAHDDGVVVVLAGHSDSRGPSAYNSKLSGERANAVRAYLVARGVPAAVMTATGRGESGFLGSNSTTDGRALNRRVDFEVAMTEESP